MDGYLPPVDLGGWLDFQRRRAQQLAQQRIAAAGSTAGDWIGRATSTVDQLVPDWAQPQAMPPPPPPPAPEPPLPGTPPPDGLPPSPGAPIGDWTQAARDRIGGVGSDLGSALAPIGAAAGTAARYLPGNLGPALASDTLTGAPSRLRDDLQQSGPGRWLGDREAETRAQQRQDDERLARMALGASPEAGGAPAGVAPEAFEAGVGRARWMRETGQNVAGGVRRGQRGYRPPKLSPEQLGQRARDGEAETRVFQAIQRLWRTGQEEVADDLRFLALGKGEAGEQAARDYLTGKGLGDALPAAPTTAEAGEATVGAAGALGAGGLAGAAALRGRDALSGLGDALGRVDATARGVARVGNYLPGNIGAALAQDVVAGTPYRLRDDLAASGAGQWLGEREEETRTQQRIEDERMARMALGDFPGQGGRPADVDPDAWEREVRRARWLRETGQNLAGTSGLRTSGFRPPSASQVNEVLASAPLASPTSLAANATSGVVRTLERLAYKVGEGRPLEALADAGAMARELGNPELWRRMTRAFESGPTPRNPGVTGVQVEGALSNAPGLAPKVLTAGVRANAATDELVRSLNEAGARAAGVRRGLTGQALDDFVRQAGDFATVTGPNSPVASALNKAKGWVGDPDATPLEKTVGWFASAVAPYVGMPERLLVSTLSSTTAPVTAPLNALWRAVRGKPVDPRAVASRVAVGGLLDLWLAHAAAGGGIYGPPPRDRAERERMEREGAVWDSLVVGDTAIPLRYFGTVGSQASLVADVLRAQRRAAAKGEPFQGVKGAADQFLAWTLNDSYLSDATRFFSEVAAGRGTDAVARLAGGVPGRVTSIVSGPVNASDPYERDTSGIAGSLARAVPGGRYALPAEIDPATGDPVRRRGSGLTRYLGVTPGTEESAEAAELATRGVGVRAFADGTYTGVRQTPDALEAIKRVSGSEVGRETRATIASREYQEARPLEKRRLLNQALTRAYAEADVRLGDRVQRSPKAQADFEYRAVPQYEGVKGTPDEARRQNAKIADAKRQLTAARAKYPGDPDKGERELIARSRETVRLAERGRLNAEDLRRRRAAIYAKYGLNPQGQDEDALDEEAGG